MSIMTIDEMFHTHGWDVVQIGGEERYVTRDENGVAHVSDTHRRRARRTRGMFAGRTHRSARKTPQTDPEATVVLPRQWEATETITTAVVASEPPSLRTRIRHAAVDLAIVTCSLSAAVIAVKCAVWVVLL